MANAYTRFAPTQYQSQYVPAPIEQIAPAMEYAAGMRQTSQLADARTKKLLNSMGMSNDPKAQEFLGKLEQRAMGDIAQRAERGYSSQDAIETELLAEDTASSLESYQTAKQDISEWEKEYREKNPHLDREELNTRIAYMKPEIQFDNERMLAQAQAPPIEELPENIDPVEFMDNVFKGVEDQLLEDPSMERDPMTGKIKVSSRYGVPSERVRNIITAAVNASPEAQNYFSRRQEHHQMQAELSENPEALLESIIEAVPEDAREETSARIEGLLKGGYDPASAYGKIMRDVEQNQVEGFGETKYAASNTEIEYLTPTENALDSQIKDLNRKHADLNKEFNNPIGLGSPEDLTAVPKTNTKQSKENKQSQGFRAVAGYPLEAEEIETVSSVEELVAERPEMKGMIDYLQDIYPKQDEERPENYLERLNEEYLQRKEAVNTYGGTYIGYTDYKEQEADRDLIIGSKDDKHIGDVRNRKISVMNDAGKLEPMTWDQFVKYLGEDDTNDVFKEEFIDRAGLVGEYKGDNPISPSGHYMTMNIDEGSIFSSDFKDKMFMIHDNDVYSQERYRPHMEVSQLKFSPLENSKTVTVGNGSIDFKKKHQRIIEEPGKEAVIFYEDEGTPEQLAKSRYLRPVISMRDPEEDRWIPETDQEYHEIMQGLASYEMQKTKTNK